MITAKNTCTVLLTATTRLCGVRCIDDMCRYHRYRFKIGRQIRCLPCLKCGKGVNNKHQLCIKTCGYIEIERKANNLARKNKRWAIKEENRRIAELSHAI